MKIRITEALLCLLLISSYVYGEEIIQYDGKPVSIELTVGQERSINFSAHVTVGTTLSQNQRNLFRIQTAQGFLHIKANKDFESERIQVKRLDSGALMLIDLTARKAGNNSEDVRIMTPDQNQVAGSEFPDNNQTDKERLISPVDLTRFAAKQLYAPQRLVKPVNGIQPMPLGIEGAIKIFKGLNRGQVVSKPISGIQGGGFYLTTIHLVNTSDEIIQLDYLDLNIPFTHATFQHHTLYPSGQPGDDTALYLISDRPITQILIPWDYFAPQATPVNENG